MKIVIMTLLMAFLATASAQNQEENISKDTVLKAIGIFAANPLAPEADAAASIIVRFADASPDVEVTIEPKVLPWGGNETQPKYHEKLLTAYIAGNVKSQLASGQTKNDALAGILQVISTYRQLQKADPKFKIPEIEHFIELNNQKKLKEYLATP